MTRDRQEFLLYLVAFGAMFTVVFLPSMGSAAIAIGIALGVAMAAALTSGDRSSEDGPGADEPDPGSPDSGA